MTENFLGKLCLCEVKFSGKSKVFVIHQNIKYVIRCYLFEGSKSNELKVVLKLGNLRTQADQNESLSLGKVSKIKFVEISNRWVEGGGLMIFSSLTLPMGFT